MPKKLYIFLILQLVVTLLMFGVFLVKPLIGELFDPEVIVVEKVVFSVDENAILFQRISEGRELEIYEFYDRYTGDRRLTYLIVSNALSRGIPVHYFMALAYTESRFTPRALGVNRMPTGEIRSTDYGLFQLNSISYKTYTKDFLMDLDNNVRLAADHLYRDYVRYGTWYEALLAYNAGQVESLRDGTLRHFLSVVAWHKIFTENFVEVILNDS